MDCVVFGFDDGELKVLLIERALEPFKGKWALPGGFVRVDETLDDAARRELGEEAGLKDVFLEQLYTFGTVDRDPRERIVSVAYYALVKLAAHDTKAATDAADARWYPISKVPKLAFDHADILGAAVKRLRGKLGYAPVGYELLPRSFTLRQLQDIHEAILGRALNKDSFRRRMLAGGHLRATGQREADVAYRPAELYRFVKNTSPRGRKENNDG